MKLKVLFGLIVILIISCGQDAEKWVMSPDGKIMVDLRTNDQGQPFYNVEYAGSTVFESNLLGIVREDADYSAGMEIVKVSETEEVTDNYSMLHGKQKNISYKANRKIYILENGDGNEMQIVFQVSDDGFGFRYIFPEESDEIHKISDEKTTFQFDESTVSWIQPMSKAKTGWEKVHPSYEEHYVNEIQVDSLPVHEPGWIYPALFKKGNFWIAITESAPDRDYCGTRLMLNKGQSSFEIGFPEPVENKDNGAVNPESTLPWKTPWRIVVLGDDLSTLVESTLGTDLAAPSVLQDYSFVKPGRSSWSWVMYKDKSVVYPVQKDFIDYASDMGWEYCLVDVDWDTRIGYDKIKELADYAKTKNVGLVLWYNSAGDWNTTPYHPRDMLLTEESRNAEFKKISEMGIAGVKVDFFGGDGQSVISYYQDIFESAAKYGLIVNCHGSTLPRCWHRTYPNMATMEAIKGFEFVTFEQVNADLEAKHSAVLPFTRNLFDPMDFTPVCFSGISHLELKTTNAFELALSVLFLSGVQHYAEVPEGMAKVPADIKQIMKDVPVDWDETKFVDGYPADYVVIARKKNNVWYVAGINGNETEQDLSLDLSFIDGAKEVTFVTDGENNRTFKINKEAVDFGQKLDLTLQPNGGFLIQVKI